MGKQAVLPEDMEDGGIDSMMTGEVAYTLPWAMWVDTERRCWLHPNYPAEESPRGTAEMRIELRQDGYHVYAPPGKTWSVRNESGFYGGRGIDFIPVAELHGGC